MNRIWRAPLIVIVMSILLESNVYGQLVVSPNQTATQLVDKLVGAGVTYTNPSLTCPQNGSGSYTNGATTTILIDEGVVLTSGRFNTLGAAIGVNAPASSFASNNNATTGGDVDLANAATGAFYDLCKLEFDFVPIGDTIEFQYRFGSEEYPTYNCSNYNDIFAFFISGPGYPTPTNVALVPGTNIPVAINSINGGQNMGPACTNMGPGSPFTALYVNNTASPNIVYNGLTTILTAKTNVVPCSTYHMKFAIADVYDHILDSGVFLEAGSFQSGAATVSSYTSSNNLSSTPTSIEGCTSGTVTIKRPAANPYNQVVQLFYGGNAINGVDVLTLPSSITIPAYDSQVVLTVTAIQDNIPEGTEFFTIYLSGNNCSPAISDSIQFQILDYPNFTVTPDDTICQGDTKTLSAIPNPANGNLIFNWTPFGSTSPTSGSIVTATPATSTTYTVTAVYPGCPDRDSVVVITVEPTPVLNVTATPITCYNNNNAVITATGSVTYTPFQISLNPGAQTQTISPAVFSNLGPATYTVTISSAVGCTNTATVSIIQPAQLLWTGAVGSTIPCTSTNTGTIGVTTSGGIAPITYVLNPGSLTNTSGNFTGLNANNYTITATDANGCTITTLVDVIQQTPMNWGAVTSIDIDCFGNNNGSISISAIGGASPISYNLMPTNQTNTTGSFTNLGPALYTVTATDMNNCVLSTTISIVEPALLIWNSVASTNVNCNNANDGTITVVTSGGTLPVSYLLNPGNTTNGTGVFSNLGNNTYTVTATDANNCSISTVVVISQPTPLILNSVTTTNPTCIPGNDGNITILASGGTVTYSYSIGGPLQAGNVFNNLGAGNYIVTVTDGNNCTVTSAVSISAPNAPTISAASAVAVTCFGGSNGSLLVTGAGGLAPLTYTLQPGAISNSSGAFSNLLAGLYTVTIGDANGCTISTTLNVTEPIALSVDSIIVQDISCFGGNNGQLAAYGSGGTTPYSYNLQPTNATNTNGVFANLLAGVYTITIGDANGCTATSTATIIEPSALTWQSTSNTTVSCNGGSDGTIASQINGGTAPYSYTIQPTNATNVTGSFSNLIAGTYTITASDANSCTLSTVVIITEPTPLAISSISSTVPSCVPGNDAVVTVTATGGTIAYQYSLGGPQQSSNIFPNVGVGTYTVTVTDANNCTLSSTVVILAPTLPTITSINATNVNCNGGSNGSITVVGNGGLAPINYTIQPSNLSNTTGSFTGLSAAIYTIIVGDGNGCTVSAVQAVTDPPVLLIDSIVATDILCFGGNNGAIVSYASGGTSPFAYNLQPSNTSNTTGSYSNLSAGIYTLMVTDANGCTISSTTSIIEPAALSWSTYSNLNVSCFGGADGSLNAQVIGGTLPISYNLQPNNLTNSSGAFSNLMAGTYTVLATDANNCTLSTLLLITEPTPLVINSVSSTIPTCVPGNDANITIVSSGGTAPYQYANGVGPLQGSNVYNNVGAGVYTITVSDANNCSITTTVTVTAPTLPTIASITSSNINCNGGNNGSINIVGTGGLAPMSYTLQPSNQTNNTGVFASLTANVYTITVGDANGCTVSTIQSITEPPVLIIDSLIATDILCFNANNGIIVSYASGGTNPLTYNIQPSNSTNTSGTFNNLMVGNYTILVTDSNGCTTNGTAIINEPSALNWVSVSNTIPSCVPGNDASITINVSGGTPVYSYSAGGTPQAGNVINNIGAGFYTITVTDANGCTITSTINITTPNSPIFGAMTITDVSCNGGSDGTISGIATGGNGAISYVLMPGNLTNGTGVFINLAAATYTITATDVVGCSVVTSVVVNQPTPFVWNTAVITPVSCNGLNDGSILQNVTGGVGTISYTLQPGNLTNTSGSFTNLTANNYSITISDANGCTATSAYLITEPNALIWDTIALVNVNCNGGADGEVSVSVLGGTSPYVYNLLPNNVSNGVGLYTGLTAGTYTVNVVDANNCTLTTALSITEPSPLQIGSVSNTIPSCVPGNDAQITITAQGGTPNYLYNNGGANQGSNIITNVGVGVYTITVTDANGCTATSTINVASPNNPQIANLSSTNINCNGANNGSITIGASGGTGTINYSLQPSNTANTTGLFINLAPASYTITVSDALGCTVSTTVSITEPNALVWNTNAVVPVSCFGLSDGNLTQTVNGGTGVITYNLQPGNITNGSGQFLNLIANAYTVTATDANGCSLSTIIQVVEPPLLQWSSTNSVNVSCAGGDNGSITVSAIGGTPTLTYTLLPSNLSNNVGTFTNLVANAYTINCVDANGCSVSTVINITQPAPLMINNISVSDVTCNGFGNGSILVNAIGGNNPLAYLLQPGNVSNANGVFNNLSGNTYTVTITDANNCSISTIQIVNEPLPIVIDSVQLSQVDCYGANNGSIQLFVTNGINPLSYNLQPSNTTNGTGLFNNLSPATYTITTTDATGCSISTMAVITEPPLLSIDSFTSTNILCNGQSTGIIQLSTNGGTPIINYSLQPTIQNNTTGLFANLPASSYTVMITDANNCSLSTTVVLSEPGPITSTYSTTDVICNGENNGTLTVTTSGGVLPMSYLLLPSSQSNNSGLFTNLSPTIYSVIITDSNACADTIQSITINQPQPVVVVTQSIRDVSCFGGNDGEITVGGSGGNSPLQYTIMPSIGSQITNGVFTNLTAGVYVIYGQDALGCKDSISITLNQNPEIVILDVLYEAPRCYGEDNGSITVLASGGNGILQSQLNGGPITSNFSFTNLKAGVYTLSIIDTLGCRKDTSLQLIGPDRLELDFIEVYNITCENKADGRFKTKAKGGNGKYVYYIRPGIAFNTHGTFTSLAMGTYTLTVRDSLGCQFDTILVVGLPDNLMTTKINKKNLGCFGFGNEGWAEVVVNGGVSPITYLWTTDPPQTTPAVSGLFFGYYYVTVSDAVGCEKKVELYIEPGPCCDQVFFPNAFSPNGDGKNDVFRMITSAGIVLKQLEIYNRWGQRVWVTEDFRATWDGTFLGEPAPLDTYYYVFHYDCLTDGKEYIKKGDVILVR